jgi:hypothetical protein
MTWSTSPANAGSSTSKSSMTISADQQAERWRGPASTRTGRFGMAFLVREPGGG